MKNKFLYALLTIITITFLWLGFFLVPKLSEFESLIDESGQYKEKLASVVKKINKTGSLEKDIQDLNHDIKNMKRKLFKNASLAEIAEVIQREFDKYNVNIIQISPVYKPFLDQQKSAGKLFNRLPLEIILEGRFMDFVHLLENSENMTFLMKPDQILMKTKSDDLLLIGLNVSVFVLTGEEI